MSRLERRLLLSSHPTQIAPAYKNGRWKGKIGTTSMWPVALFRIEPSDSRQNVLAPDTDKPTNDWWFRTQYCRQGKSSGTVVGS